MGSSGKNQLQGSTRLVDIHVLFEVTHATLSLVSQEYPLTHESWKGERPDFLSLRKNLEDLLPKGLPGSGQDSIQGVKGISQDDFILHVTESQEHI